MRENKQMRDYNIYMWTLGLLLIEIYVFPLNFQSQVPTTRK